MRTFQQNFDEVLELLAAVGAQGVLGESQVDALAAALRGRDLLLDRCRPEIERLLAAQGDTPDRDLVALQHELAAHLAPAPSPFVNPPQP